MKILLRKIVLLGVLALSFSSVAISQTVVGQDQADNYSTWSDGDNLGTGFGPWNLTITNHAGFFLGNSSVEGFGNVNSPTKSFSMWGNPGGGGNYANAERHVSTWGSGYSFEIDLAIAFKNGNKGIDIYGAGDEVIFTFNVEGNEYKAQGADLGWIYSQTSIFHLTALQYPNHLKITLTRGSETHSSVILNKEFSGFKVFIGDTDSGNSLNNIHINNLIIKSSPYLLFDDFDRTTSNNVGTPSSGALGTYLENETVASGARVDGSHLRFASSLTGREMAAFDMSALYPIAYDASSEEMKWAFNMMSSRSAPSGFDSGDYGSAFILGSNKSNFTDSDAYGYAVVIGGTGSPDPLRLVKFENGFILNSHLDEIASVPVVDENSFFSVNVSYNSCTSTWELLVREELSFTNPSIGSFPLSDSGSDNTYTATELPYLGALWNHATDGSEFMRIDNIYIPVGSPASTIEYVWSGGASGSFLTPSNWTPSRDCARSRDRLVFDGGTSEVIDVPDQSIGQLVVRNNASVVLRNEISEQVSTLEFTGGLGEDLIIESGSTLNLNSKNASYTTEGIRLIMNTTTTGEIGGVLQFDNSFNSAGRRHQVLVADSDALHVTNGGSIEAIDLLIGSNPPFGSDNAGYNAIVFESGSTYLQASGSNPFALSLPNSKVVFEPGSWLHFTASGTPAVSGRTYANFRYDVNSADDLTGSNAYFIDTLVIERGTLNFKLNATGTITGDIEVASGATLNFNPTSGVAQVLINAPVIQNIFGPGNMTIGNGVTLNLQNQNRINIQKSVSIAGSGPANILPNAIVSFEGENYFSGSGTTNIQNNSKVYIGSAGGIAASGSSGNIRTTTRSYSAETAYVYKGVANQITGTGLPATLSGNASLEIDNPGNTVTLTNPGTTTTPLLTLTNGLFAVGVTNTLAIAAGGNLESTAGNFAAGNLAGTVSFLGTGIVNATGALDFWDVELAAGSGDLDFGAAGIPIIHHEMVINSGRYVDPIGPFYADNSTLVYNTAGDFTTGADWYANVASGRGVPYNVQVGRSGVNNTKLNFGSSDAWRHLRNTITVGDGVGTGYGFYLSNVAGGDLKLEGDFLVNANGDFGANESAVFFVGNTDQLISSNAAGNTVSFDYLILDKSAGDLLLDHSPGTTVNILGNSGGDALVLSDGDIDMQGQTINLGGSAPTMRVQGGMRTVKSATAATFNVIGAKEVLSTGGSLVFDEQVTVVISDGINFGPDVTTINATLQIDAGGFANLNAPIYGPLGVLKYNTGGDYDRRVEWNGTDGIAGFPNDVIVANNTNLSPAGFGGENAASSFGTRRDVTIENGSSIYMDNGGVNMTVPFIIGRNLIIDGALSGSGAVDGDIHVAGNWVRSATGNFYPNNRQVLFNGATAQTITAAGGEVFDYLGFENSGTKDLLSDITVIKNIDFYPVTGALSGDGRTIRLYEDWNNNAGEAAFAEANTTVSFNGYGLQELNCAVSAFEGFHNLRMDNGDVGIQLNNHASLSGNLEFIDGLIDATSYRVDFENGATSSGSSSASYINGLARKIGFVNGIEFMFPVGQFLAGADPIDVYQPAGLIASSTSATATFTVDYNHESYFPWALDPNNLPPMMAPLEKASTCNYWNINRDVSSISARVKLYWTDACFDISNPNDLVVAKVDGGQWVSQGPAVALSTVPYTVGAVLTTAAVSSFSPFAIGSTSSFNVLPIQLLSFSASANGNVVETNWVTATETNNDYFTVERSNDAVNFEFVGRVEGAGNSTTQLGYAFADDAPYSGISYYRLKQTDFDGVTSYSQIKAVEIDSDSNFDLLSVYRNEEGRLNLVYRSEVNVLNVEVFDLLGKRLFEEVISNNNGQNTLSPSLVRGVYLLRLNNGVEVVSKKFFY